jgi:threonine dehydrogenase-like Zn-dependent dehydrogenase
MPRSTRAIQIGVQSFQQLPPKDPMSLSKPLEPRRRFLQAVEVAASCGRVVYIGYAKNAITYDTKTFITKELDIRGSRNALIDDFRDVIDELRANPDVADRVISRIVPLAEAPAALAEWNRDPGGYTKILVEI